MSRVTVAFALLGLSFAIAGLVLATAFADRFLGFAFLLVGAFLLILPFTRPYSDE